MISCSIPSFSYISFLFDKICCTNYKDIMQFVVFVMDQVFGLLKIKWLFKNRKALQSIIMDTCMLLDKNRQMWSLYHMMGSITNNFWLRMTVYFIHLLFSLIRITEKFLLQIFLHNTRMNRYDSSSLLQYTNLSVSIANIKWHGYTWIIEK